MTADVVFEETVAEERANASPLSHLSVELGHLYMEDFAGGPEALRQHFRRVAPWARAAAQTVDVSRAATGPGSAPAS